MASRAKQENVVKRQSRRSSSQRQKPISPDIGATNSQSNCGETTPFRPSNRPVSNFGSITVSCYSVVAGNHCTHFVIKTRPPAITTENLESHGFPVRGGRKNTSCELENRKQKRRKNVFKNSSLASLSLSPYFAIQHIQKPLRQTYVFADSLLILSTYKANDISHVSWLLLRARDEKTKQKRNVPPICHSEITYMMNYYSTSQNAHLAEYALQQTL